MQGFVRPPIFAPLTSFPYEKPSFHVRPDPPALASRMRGTHPEVLEAHAARCSYLNVVRGDLCAMTGAPDMQRALERVDSLDGLRARKFISLSEAARRNMSNASYAAGVEALQGAFASLSSRALHLADRHRMRPHVTLAPGDWPALARAVLYLLMDTLEMAHGPGRQAHVERFIVTVAAAADEKPLTFARIQTLACRYLGVPEPEGKAGTGARTQSVDARRADTWACHPVMLDLTKAPEFAYAERFQQMLDLLVAGFVGAVPEGFDPAEALLPVLCRRGDAADHERAAVLLRSRGRIYGDRERGWSSVARLVQVAHAAAVRLHDDLVRSGKPVPVSEARDIVRVALGDAFEFQHRFISEADRAYRNQRSVQVFEAVDRLVLESAPDLTVTQSSLRFIVARSLAPRDAPDAPHDRWRSTGGSEPSGEMPSPQRGDAPTGTCASPGAPGTPTSSRAVRTVSAFRSAPAAVIDALREAREKLHQAQLEIVAGPRRTEALQVVREQLAAAKAGMLRARTAVPEGGMPPAWVAGVAGQIQVLTVFLDRAAKDL